MKCARNSTLTTEYKNCQTLQKQLIFANYLFHTCIPRCRYTCTKWLQKSHALYT